jgi:glycosyltransferase involved in cell wall biosynthesis
VGFFGARVRDVGATRGRLRRLLQCFGREHRANRFDVIHAFFGWPAFHAAVVGRRYRVPVLFHAAGGEFVDFQDIGYGMQCTWRGRLSLRVALACSSGVSVASQSMQRLASRHGVAAASVPLGVALDRWPTSAPRRRNASEPLRLLHIGDLRPVKDQQTLIDATALAADAGTPLTLDMVGLDTDGESLRASAAAGRLGDRIRWHGVLGREALRARVDETDLLVMSSRHEAGPLAVLEAAIAGVPTAGTNVGHIAELAPDAAVAVPVGDASALARAIVALASDEPRRLALGTEAQRRALAIDADYTARMFDAMYHSVAATPSAVR